MHAKLLKSMLLCLAVSVAAPAEGRDLRARTLKAPKARTLAVPVPLYVEMVADFNSASFGLPAGYANHPISGAAGYELVLTVTGAAGAQTLTVNSGTIADAGVSGTYGWGAVVQHDDGSWGSYTVSAADAGGGTVTVQPGLRKAVTGGTLANTHDAVNGQHYTPSGYRALASHVFTYPTQKAYRQTFIAQHQGSVASDGPWVEVNALPEAWFTCGNTENAFPTSLAATSPAATLYHSRSTAKCYMSTNQTTGTSGVEWTQALGGKTGYVDSYIGTATVADALRVQVIIDGVTVLDKMTNGLERIYAPFTNATSGTIRYTLPATSTTLDQSYRLGTTTWWETPSDLPATMFPRRSRVVYVGDSWGTYYSGLGPSRLGELLAANGGALVANSSLAGQQATWAITNFDALVAAHKPTHVVIEYFVNDYNALASEGVATWKERIATLTSMVLAIGAQPVVIMPSLTASQTQAQGLANYAAQLAEGAP